MKLFFTILLVTTLGAAIACPQKLEPIDDAAEVNELAKRFQKPENVNVFQGAVWTVTHDYAEHKHMDEVMKSVFAYLEALAKFQSGESEPLAKLGGVSGFKRKLTDLLNDGDQAIRSFAAVMIGITGDKALVPSLAKLLDKQTAAGERYSMVYDRGRAALALGMIGAVEYKPRIAELLKSENQYDRSGAIAALESFGATEYAKEIADQLSRSGAVDDDPSPVHFLIATGVAKDYKPQLVKAMLDKFRSETSDAAMYALVKLDAKEHSKEIATLLDEEFRKAEAAKALALLGATNYTRRIALLLKDKSGLVRSAAALALGVLAAKEQGSAVAELLKDPEDYVRNYAAAALMLMQAERYYAAALPLLETPHQGRAYLTESSFSPLVDEKTREVTQRLITAMETAKARVISNQ
jgi:HEAT repeat protein